MAKFKPFFLSVIFCFCILSIGVGQSCYNIIENMTGVDGSGYQPQLETAACQVRDTIPSDFQNAFGVFDFSFYQVVETTSGGFEEEWSKALQAIESTSTYFIAFGREATAAGGVDVRFRVKLSPPRTGELSCLTDQTIQGTEQEILMILSQAGKPYQQKAVEAMRAFNSMIQRAKDCCLGSRSSSTIDTSLLKIQACLGDCNANFATQNSVTLIVDNAMPLISFRLYYPPQFSFMCSKLFVQLGIHYIRETNVPHRNRNDYEVFEVYDMGLNDFVTVDFGGAIRGGRAEIIVKETPLSPDVLKSFKFTIKGKNPKIGDVMEYLEDEYSEVWFFKKMALKESATDAMDASLEMEHFMPYKASNENLHEDWNADSRCPKASYNGDGGFGLMQVTHPKPSSQALWDWKQNISEAYDILIVKIDEQVKPKLLPELAIVEMWNSDPSNPKIDKIVIDYGGVIWKMGGSPVFGDESSAINNYFNESLTGEERSFLDACLMLAYNGYGGTGNKNFLKLVTPQQGKPYWATKDNSNNYVKKISERAVPPPY